MIFADTSFFFAGLEPDDACHGLAVQLTALIDREKIVTTNHIRGETWTLLRARDGHRAAVKFLDDLRSSSRTEVARIDRQIEDEALDWLRRHDERKYSFVDATSFAFMRANGITKALAFDGDFAAAGFVELRP